MAENKKSFLMYCDLIHTVEKMPDKEAGKLFKHILEYVNDKDPEAEDLLLQLVFEPIKQQLKRDLNKYENVCERNKINGSKGGRPKNPSKPKKPTGLFGNPSKPKKPDSDNDNDTDSDNDIENKFNEFWDKYHEISCKEKTDKEAALKKWDKLTNEEKQKAIDNINPYCESIIDKKYIKKARTYLNDKNFNDEYNKVDNGISKLPTRYLVEHHSLMGDEMLFQHELDNWNQPYPKEECKITKVTKSLNPLS